MPYLTRDELNTHLRPEIIDKITREDDTVIDTAISSAISEAKSYLGKYDLSKLFNPDAEGFVNDLALKMRVKDFTCWNLVKLANPNLQTDMLRTSYEDAIRWFENIMKGQIDPDGWPYKTDDTETNRQEGQSFYSTSNTKRTNHW